MELIILFIYIYFIYVKLRFIWSAKKNWWKGASEPPWIIVQAIVVLGFKTIFWVLHATDKYEIYLQDGGWPTVYCPSRAVAFIEGWITAWNFVYFNPSVRLALVTLTKVLAGLGPLTAMVLACFVGHFFIFEGLAFGVPNPQAGFGNQDSRVGGTMSPNYVDAVYNLFGLMTTVNHPVTP